MQHLDLLIIQLSLISKKILFLLTVMLALSFAGIAQKAPGKLAGKISDATTNESLNGVSVTAKGTKYGTASQSDGTYTLTLPAGTYTLIYSITGYKAKEISGIEIKSGETNFFNMLLSSASTELSVVTVTTARRESQAAVYNNIKRSTAASDGISIEAIIKTPDNNAGQIAKRITGVSVQENRFVVVRGLAEQYNQTILNGVPMTSTETDKNAFSLDLIPTAVIDNIVVNKTATPDMPGNFAGGLVQINTKDFPTSDFISVSLQGNFYDQTRGKDFYSDKRSNLEWLSFGGKIRDLPNGFPMPLDKTPLIQLNSQEKVRYLSQLPNNLAPINNGSSNLNHTIQLGFGKSFRFENGSQFGIVMAITQRKMELIEQEVTAREPVITGSNGDFSFLNYYSDNIRYNYASTLGGGLNLAYRFGTNKITLKNLVSSIFRNLYLERPFARIESLSDLSITPGTRLAGTSHIIEERKIISSILSGEHRTGKNNETRLEWNVNIANYLSQNPDTRNFVYKKVDSTGFLLASNNTGIGLALSSKSRLWSDNKDFIFGGAFNVTSVFTLLKKKQIFKAGVLLQNRSREATGLLVPYYEPKGILDSLLAPSNIYPGGPLDYVTSFASIAGQVGNYLAGSSLLATYGSLENNIGKKLRVIWGLRIENYHQYVNVFGPFFFDNFIEPDLLPDLYTSRNTFNFLPSVNIIYALTDKMNVRGGYSATAIRPELKDLAPFNSYDFKTLQLTEGNSELKSTSVKNYDFKFEFFPSAGEIMSVAAYYKKILDPMEKVSGVDNTGGVRPVNTGQATVRGIEMEIRKRLDFIKAAPWLSNVLVFGNGSIIRSKVEAGPVDNFFINQVTEHTLSGQPDYIINAGISIQAFKKSFEVTISYNRSGDYITQLGTFNEIILSNGNKSPTTPHFWVKSRDLLDIVFTQSFLKDKGKIKFDISNLLTAPFIIYQDLNANGKFDEAATIDKTGNSANSITSGIDNTPSSIIGQRSISLAFSYNFSYSKK